MAEPFEIVDSHHHLMDMSLASYAWMAKGAMHRYGPVDPISRDYLPADYRADVAPYRIVADVHVEGHRDHHFDPVDETIWLDGLRQSTGCPTVCVAGAPLEEPDVGDVLARHAKFEFVRGIRSSPDTGSAFGPASSAKGTSMDDKAWRDGFAMLERHNLSCDLLVLYPVMDKLVRLAGDFPKTTIILNHMAYPPADLDVDKMAIWRRAIEAAADCPNVVMKVSGQSLGGVPWRAAPHAEPIRFLLKAFGAERCMFGSNFPVDRLAGSFGTIVEGMRSAVAPLGDRALRQFFRDTAARVYRIALP